MYSYEIVFGIDSKTDKKSIMETSETIVADNSLQVFNYVIERLQQFPDDEFIGIIRRHPIVKILNDS